MSLWAVGGHQARAAGTRDRDHEALYDEGVLLRIEDGRAQRVLEDRTRTGLGCAFKGVARVGDGLWVCQEGAVLEVREGEVVARFSDLRMNDLHHACVHAGRRVVVSTGADGVLLGDTFWPVVAGVAEPVGDVRRRSLKPHRGHPNHAFVVGDRVFVTRGGLGDAVSIDGDVRWPLADVVVHDGVVRPDGVWFTAVDGRLLRVDPTRGVVDREVVLASMDARRAPLGWCRGLAFDGDVAWVGFSRLRATRLRRNLAWWKGRLRRGGVVRGEHPTRVVGFDLSTARVVGDVDLERVGVHAVFGLVSADDGSVG